MRWIVNLLSTVRDWLQTVDFLGPLALRLFLVPIFWMGGTEKLMNIDSTAEWFGNAQWGLGLPYPLVMAYLASLTEVIGSVCLLFGFATRWLCIPLLVTMFIAIFAVHFENGWLAIAAGDSEAHQRLQGLLAWLAQNHQERHLFITELGTPVMLNNGIEYAVTYSIMLLALLVNGPGRYLSVDYWINRACSKKSG